MKQICVILVGSLSGLYAIMQFCELWQIYVDRSEGVSVGHAIGVMLGLIIGSGLWSAAIRWILKDRRQLSAKKTILPCISLSTLPRVGIQTHVYSHDR